MFRGFVWVAVCAVLLAGLNLTTVPKILIEVGNMKNPSDAKLLTSPAFQQHVARALLTAILKFLK